MERQKRKRVSKKNKRSWRKNTDVKDVEEFLAERSRELVTGVPAAEKTDEQLFFEERVQTGDPQPVPKSKKIKKPLRSEESLYPKFGAPGIPHGGKKRKKLVDGDSSSDGEFDNSTSYNVIHARENGELAKKMRENPPKSNLHCPTKDLWSQPEQPEAMPDDHYQKVTRRKLVRRPATLEKRSSALASIAAPHPGMSYNPSFESHQELLKMAVDVEEARERAAQQLEKKVQLAKLTHAEREVVWLNEMKEGLNSDGDAGGESDMEGEVSLQRPIRADNRKTKKQRRKERLRKEMEKQRLSEKARRLMLDEVYRLKSIKRELTSKEMAVRDKELQRLEAERMVPYQTHRLGKHKFEDIDIECQLSSQLAGSLRNLKSEGSLAVDRYKSLQRRNIIEPRVWVRKYRKYKLLIKEKRSAKLPEELPKSIHAKK